jgi:hypothetical protein
MANAAGMNLRVHLYRMQYLVQLLSFPGKRGAPRILFWQIQRHPPSGTGKKQYKNMSQTEERT